MGKKKRFSKKRAFLRLFRHPILLLFFVIAVVFAVNFAIQITRKPTEILTFLPIGSQQTPHQTWQSYGDYFQQHATPIATPDFLAALAQVESGGHALASPQWKFDWNLFKIDPSLVYRPASSSTGLYQFTDGTFDIAKRFCVQDGQVHSNNCWLNWIYSRIWPSHSIEMASAYLTHQTRKLVEETGHHSISSKRRQRLAALIHLCGPNKARRFLKSGLYLRKLGSCGSHSSRAYVQRVESLQRQFARISQIQ